MYTSVERARWQQERQGRGQHESRQQRTSKLPEQIVAALPGVDTSQCELVYEVNGAGDVVGVIVRDVTTRALIARFDLSQFVHLVSGSGQSGVLFERRG
jgi:hypothetical protein